MWLWLYDWHHSSHTTTTKCTQQRDYKQQKQQKYYWQPYVTYVYNTTDITYQQARGQYNNGHTSYSTTRCNFIILDKSVRYYNFKAILKHLLLIYAFWRSIWAETCKNSKINYLMYVLDGTFIKIIINITHVLAAREHNVAFLKVLLMQLYLGKWSP
jgi:hypothetical protein